MMGKIAVLGLKLMLVGLLAAVCLGLTYGVTRERIAEQEVEQELEACMDALPSIKDTSELKRDKRVEKEIKKEVGSIQKAYSSDKGYIFIVESKGYGGQMILAVGMDKDGKIKGVSVISHNETPGLGANAVKPEFLDKFKGKSPSDRLVVGKTVDAIAGATISSKAVTKGINNALKAYEAASK